MLVISFAKPDGILEHACTLSICYAIRGALSFMKILISAVSLGLAWAKSILDILISVYDDTGALEAMYFT